MGMMVDEKYGGSGMDTMSYVLAMEEISKVDASVSVCMSVNNSLYAMDCRPLEPRAKENYLRPWQPAKRLEHSASANPKRFRCHILATTAIDCGDHYLNGTKNWITNGGCASTYLVVAQTDADKGHHGSMP